MTADREAAIRGTHYSIDFWPNEEGWWVGRCVCGADLGIFPDAEDAADALMDHAFAAALAATEEQA